MHKKRTDARHVSRLRYAPPCVLEQRCTQQALETLERPLTCGLQNGTRSRKNRPTIDMLGELAAVAPKPLKDGIHADGGKLYLASLN